jgi:CBS-domain-containing membrane protein
MSTTVRTARATDKVLDISSHFDEISGLPVVDDQQKVIGVVSKKDLEKSSDPVSAHRRMPLYADGRLAVLCKKLHLTCSGLTTGVMLMSLSWPSIIEEMHGWDKASQQHQLWQRLPSPASALR